ASPDLPEADEIRHGRSIPRRAPAPPVAVVPNLRPDARGGRGSEDRMKLTWKNWLGAGLLTPAVALGCSSTEKHHHDGGCSTCTAAANVQHPPAYTVAAAMPRNVVTYPKAPEVNHEMAIPVPEQVKSPVAAQKIVASGAPAPYTGAGYYHSPD